MSDDKIIRDKLSSLRAELVALSAQSAEARATVTLDQQSVGRLSRMDAMQTQAMANAAEARRKTEISRIDAAFKRLDDGVYGDCLRCGEEVEPARLDFDPAATLCASCARRQG